MFDLAAARKSGYSDAEIIPYLAQQYPSFDVNGAAKAGYSLDEIVSHLSGGPAHALPADVINEPGIQDATSDIIAPIVQAGKMTKAGGAGIGNLVSGNGLQQAATDVNNVTEGNKPETTSGKVGESIGGAFTPEQIALAGGLGKFLELSGIGEWAAKILSGWSEQAARNAIGFIKNMANTSGLSDIPAIAQFVLQPVKIGTKEFPAILQVFSSPQDMLKAAETVQSAAGETLGKVSTTADAALNANPEAINLKSISDNLFKLKETVEKNTPELGRVVAGQYEKAISDFEHVLENWKASDSSELFTGLRNFKTTVGQLMGEGENVVPSKAALQRVYGVLADELDTAASKISPALGTAYSEANKAYTYATDVIDALTNKIKSEAVKPLLPSLKTLATSAPPIPSTAIARGLGTASKFLGSKFLQNATGFGGSVLNPVIQGIVSPE